MKKAKAAKLWIVIAAIITVFFVNSTANAASYPFLTLVSSQSSLVFEKGQKVDIRFKAYTGGYSKCKYFIEIRQDSINGSKVAETEGEYSNTTDCTIGWNTAEYNPGKYVMKVYCQYYENYYWHTPYDADQVYDITLKGEYASGECGSGLTWRLTDDHVLTISGSGNMKSYSFGQAPWNSISLNGIYNVEDLIEKIVINEGVTGIGNSAFYDCDSLREISLPSTLKMIGESAFDDSSLERIEMPDSVTVLGKYVFSGCGNLSYVKLSAGLKAIPYRAFDDCSFLSSIIIPKGVTSIGASAFSGCSALEQITLPSSLKAVENSAFEDCSSLSSVIYYGTGSTRNAIEFGSWDNDYLLNASWIYKGTSGESVSANKWVSTANGWKYQLSNGAFAQNEWKKIGGSWYYFNAGGIMLKGWQQISGSWYYLNSGKMVTGWKKIAGNWYYFGSSGKMATKWKKIGGSWYYFGGNGKMVTGWKKIGGKWYYFNSGKMVTGTKTIGGKTYKFSSDGKLIS